MESIQTLECTILPGHPNYFIEVRRNLLIRENPDKTLTVLGVYQPEPTFRSLTDSEKTTVRSMNLPIEESN